MKINLKSVARITLIVLLIVGLFVFYVIYSSGQYYRNHFPELYDETSAVKISGYVSLGPTCPGMREGGESCSDKPYETNINIIFQNEDSDKAYSLARTPSNAEGFYEAKFNPGNSGWLIIEAEGGEPFPRCNVEKIPIVMGETYEVDMMCDTGIR